MRNFKLAIFGIFPIFELSDVFFAFKFKMWLMYYATDPQAYFF